MSSSGPSRRRRWLFIGLYPIYIAAVVWLGAQFFWVLQEKQTGQAKSDVWGYYYRKLPPVRDAELRKNDETLDVLLLGGSVLEQVAPVFEQVLAAEMNRPVRTFSLCTSAHTSRDSYLKLMQLREKPFDLIVVYHGINDARMNCVPDELFQMDYTHCAHYAGLKRAVEAGSLTIRGLVRDRVEDLIGLGEPEAEMMEYGKTLKTPPAFARILRASCGQLGFKQRPCC